ncbi:phospholipase A [Silvanigrella aquatica]|uniref:Phosphatidylcholine 1-acylhydrolase n=1 Tax=Silvanigrella aquatica TaxID=1915309 RepID=A0A1L4CXL7_9BACT|nr:phospholipase A [Silvanigrella aquatica]APJ02690.1 hypothetical protein AXG55_01585 [Silvanigrella aquatica]
MFELYQDNYFLPYYYTASPYYNISNQMQNNTPVTNDEIKWQLSLYSLIYDWDNLSIASSFTIKAFWQVNTSRPWFRSADYNPELFIAYKFSNEIKTTLGISHESNGKGDQFERSWNRLFANFKYTDDHFLFEFMPWIIPIKNNEAVEYQNDKIEDYLGREKITIGYKINYFETKLSIQNIEDLTRIQYTFSESIQFSNHYAIYFQYFYGYGQSLLEYNHFTQAYGIGIQFMEDKSNTTCNCNKNI